MKKRIIALLFALSIILAACGTTTYQNEASSAQRAISSGQGNPSAGQPASSTGSLSGGWLYSYSNAVEFFQLTVNDNQVSGQEQEEYMTDSTPPSLQQDSSTVSGIFNGTQVTLTFSVYGFPIRTYAGTYENNALTLTVPNQSGNLQNITYQPASADDYNNAVQRFQQSVNQAIQAYNDGMATATAAAYQQQMAAATASAIADDQQRLVYDLSNIGGAINQLTSDADFSSVINSYSSDLSSMQKDYSTEQSDASQGCNNLNIVAGDLNSVYGDNNSIYGDDNSFSSQSSSVQGDISNVQDYVSKIQQHWSDLGQQPFSGVSASDVSNAVQSGNTAIAQATKSMNDAQSKSSGYDNQAKQIVQQAQALYNGMNC